MKINRKSIIVPQLAVLLLVVVMVLSSMMIFVPATAAEEEPWVPDMDEWPYNLFADGSDIPETPESTVEVISCDVSGLQLRFTVGNVLLNEENHGGNDYIAPMIDGYGHTTEIGDPQLPVMRRLIIVPHGAEVAISVNTALYSELEGVEVWPVQEPESEATPNPPFSKDVKTYKNNQFLPGTVVAIEDRGIFRDYDVLHVVVNAVQWNPNTEVMRVYYDVTLDLAFDGGTIGGDEPAASFEALYEESLLNYDQAIDWTVTVEPTTIGIGLMDPTNEARYLIITYDDFYNAIQPLAADKAARMPTMTVTTSEVYAEFPGQPDEAIHDFVNYAFLNWNVAPEYLLLVGDNEELPTHQLDLPGYSYSPIPSDYYYALVGDTDIYPDLAIGRISAHTTDEVTLQVNKILGYKYSPPVGDWTYKVHLAAHEQNAPGYFQGCKEDIRTEIIGESEMGDIYEVSTAYPYEGATKYDVIDAINEGCAIVNYQGHGGITGWGGGVAVNKYDVMGLQNGDMLPIVFSFACYNAQFDYAYGDCISEAWLKAPNGGAVASVAAADISWISYNIFMDKDAFSTMFLEEETRIGHVVNHFKIATLDKYGSSSAYPTSNVWMYMLMGDPETTLVGVDVPDHDVAVSNMNAPTGIEPNQNAIVSADISNRGTFDEQNIQVEFLIDGIVQDTIFIPYLASRDSQAVHFEFSPTVEGDYTVTIMATVVPGDELPMNNVADRNIHVKVSYPYVVSTTPKDGMVEVTAAQSIIIEFSEPMDPSSVIGHFQVSPAISGTFDWTDDHTLVLAPTVPLTAATTYIIQIEAGATDWLGYPLDGNGDGVPGDDFEFSFTVDSIAPYVSYTYPYNGAMNVPTNTNIQITFNELVNLDSVGNSLEFIPSVMGTWASGCSRYFEFVPDDLDAQTTYQIRVGPGIIDQAGNVMTIPHRFSFTTSTLDWAEPTQVSTEPLSAMWPAVDTDAQGSSHIVFVGSGDDGQNIYYSKIDADGTVLVQDNKLTDDFSTFAPDIGVDSDGNVHIVYTWVDPIKTYPQPTHLCYIKLDNNGNVLVPATQISDGLRAAGGRIAIDEDNNVHIAFLVQSGFIWWDADTNLYYMRLDSDGNVDIEPFMASDKHNAYLPDIAVDSGGNAHIVWFSQRRSWILIPAEEGFKPYPIYKPKVDPQTGIFACIVNWHGVKSGQDRKVAATFQSNVQSSLAIDANDDVHVVWHDRSSGLIPRDPYAPVPIIPPFYRYDNIYYAKLDDNNNRYGQPKVVAYTGSDSKDPRVGIDLVGQVYVVWLERHVYIQPQRYDLYFAKLTNDGNPLKKPEALRTLSHWWTMPDIDIDVFDDIHIVYEDYMGNFPQVFHTKGEQIIQAEMYFSPSSLNWHDSQGNYVTVTIDFNGQADVYDVDIDSLRLNGVMSIVEGSETYKDYNHDKNVDLQVKFDRAAVDDIIYSNEAYVMSISGLVNGEMFEGYTTVKVFGWYWIK